MWRPRRQHNEADYDDCQEQADARVVAIPAGTCQREALVELGHYK